MENKDIVLASIALLGWSWAIIQFFLNRKNQKRDKALEKRFEVYSEFMVKADELNQNLRTDPNMMYGISTNFMSKLMSAEPEEMNDVFLEFNSDLIELTKKAVQPTMTLNQELNKLKLVCSNKLLPKIDEYKTLANDYVNEFQIVMNNLSSNKDLSITAKELENIGHSERSKMIDKLWREIEAIKRNEIGYYKHN